MTSSIRVLHVDDDPDFGELAAEFLERSDEGMTVVTETAAADGIERLRAGTFDCVVSDYDMPGRNGLEFLETVREEDSDLPFILYTGKGSEAVASEAISMGATDYLQKDGGTEQYELLANRVRNAVEKHRSRKEAERTRRRLRNLAESTPHCVWMFDRDWDELLFISGYETVWDRPTETIRENPQDFLESVHPDDREFVRDAMGRMSDGESIDIEYRILRGDDESGWVWVQGEPVFDDDGAVKSVVGFTRDVTERKRREHRLERYERIVGNLPIGVFRTTRDGEFVSMNDRFVSLFGGDSPADFEPLSAADLYVDPADREALLRQLDRDGVVQDHLLEMRTLDGATLWAETTLRIVEEDGEQYLDGIMQDVSERRERRRRLEQAETMFENAQDAMFLIDVGESFTIERVNPAYEDATGLSNDALSGRTPRDVLGDEQGADIERKYRECVERRTTLEYEEELTIDGERTYWATRIAPVVIDGAVEQIAGATRDVTARKNRERELQRAERRYRAILDDPNILAGVLDTDGTVLEQNRTALEYIDADVADVEGEPFWETPWWSEEMRPAVRERVERAASGEYVEYEADLRKPDGDPYSVEGTIRPVTDDDGAVVSLVVSARDVTERVVREKRLEAILDHTTTPLFMKDRDGAYLLVNRGFRELFGLEGTTVRGRTDADLFPAEMIAEVRRNDQEVLETGEPLEAEERIVIDGEERTFLTSKTPVYDVGTESDPDVPGAVFGVATDITEQIRRERQLERQNERFDELASAVSHDLQTPLATARGRAELAVETGDTEQMERALDALERADELREDLVEVLRTREIVGETEPVDVERVGRDAWEAVGAPDDATLRVGDPPTVEADPDALRRLFENLLSNAAEHGSEDVTVRIDDADGGFVVEDDGPGIPEAERDRVFTPGYSTKQGGSGVGLASVRQIVVAHDWDVHVTDGSEGGARFEITGVDGSGE